MLQAGQSIYSIDLDREMTSNRMFVLVEWEYEGATKSHHCVRKYRVGKHRIRSDRQFTEAIPLYMQLKLFETPAEAVDSEVRAREKTIEGLQSKIQMLEREITELRLLVELD
jgi:hypothetical protein